MEQVVYSLNLLGTLIFAISGVMSAIDKKLDFVGAFVVGFVTALGGGTVRDILIGKTPVSWMEDLNSVYAILLSLPLCVLFGKRLLKLKRGFFFFDTIGIGLFSILGFEKTLSLGLSPFIAMLMGVTSAVCGGMIRDILCNEVPLILRKEIYASACFLGILVYMTLSYFSRFEYLNMGVSIMVIILIRYISIKKKWGLRLKIFQ